MADDEWLTIVGAKGWIVFSHDRKFHSDAPCVMAIKQHAIGCFYLTGGDFPLWDKFRIFAKNYKRIEEIVADRRRPFIYNIKPNRIIRVKVPE